MGLRCNLKYFKNLFVFWKASLDGIPPTPPTPLSGGVLTPTLGTTWPEHGVSRWGINQTKNLNHVCFTYFFPKDYFFHFRWFLEHVVLMFSCLMVILISFNKLINVLQRGCEVMLYSCMGGTSIPGPIITVQTHMMSLLQDGSACIRNILTLFLHSGKKMMHCSFLCTVNNLVSIKIYRNF